ncbi:DNA-binding protein WhiA [Propionimicrobium sp. BV2F7]|uniref:DNA-binding protein WhiA n=1 Tax=Propionimicrobium sp. BV2F7 TaxID=1111131 RepID=UPI0003D79C6C|nr:DNA-binding protein WhiA [Propionimicrobium sp. BV2F7]ETJ98372.1 hypothetical protein HMPREF1255_1765 [Propionimicrobium sp. BV2F7]
MALTQQVKSELANVIVEKPRTRLAELAAMLRFAGGLHLVGGKIVVEAEFDIGASARRVRTTLKDLYGYDSELIVINQSGIRRGARYVVRLIKGGNDLARQVGLIDGRGMPVRGMPAQIVGAGYDEQVAAWRGAFLARGTLIEPGRSTSLEVACPSSEAALAMVGMARRLGATAKARESRGVDKVVIKDGDTISQLLTTMGAHDAVLVWEDQRMRREVRASATRLANFDDANLRRSARAAVVAGARVKRAFEILGDDIPEHLLKAGKLRMEHKQASLEELGNLHEPPITKDAIAGRIRRLLAMADKAAQDQGIPDTESALQQAENKN